MAMKHGLGRGLNALLKDNATPETATVSSTGVMQAAIESIQKNRFQPRHKFNPERLAELTESIRQRGVIEPLLVRRIPGGYELIAGERRLRASTDAGLKQVPVIVMDVPDSESLEVALIENLHREDLSVLEEAQGYQMLSDKFGMTQEEIASKVGKARATVTNSLRLLGLPDEIRGFLAAGEIDPGHAKVLLGLDSPTEQILFARRTVKEAISVRSLEKLVNRARKGPRKRRATRDDIPADHLRLISDKLHHHFGTNVRITPTKTYANGKKANGVIEVVFYSNEDLTRILEILNISLE